MDEIDEIQSISHGVKWGACHAVMSYLRGEVRILAFECAGRFPRAQRAIDGEVKLWPLQGCICCPSSSQTSKLMCRTVEDEMRRPSSLFQARLDFGHRSEDLLAPIRRTKCMRPMR